MTIVAGWYLDPHAPHQLRWWDGGQWTAHSAPIPSVAPIGQFVGQAPTNRPSRRRGVAVAVVAGIAVALVLIGLPVAVRVGQQRSNACADTKITAGMSSQTAAYLRAADESNAAALALSRQLDANPRGVVTIDQTRQFMTNTLAFRDSLSGIPFVGQASVDAQLVIAGLSALANDLGEQLMNPDVSIRSRIQNDYAEADTHRLRADLGLPTVGPACTYTSVM